MSKQTESASEPRVGRWLIYGLLDPSTQTLFYVGKTHKRRELRLNEHVAAAMEGSKYPVHEKIRALLSAGRKPEIFVLQRVRPEDSWKRAEREQIEFWRNVNSSYLPFIHPSQTPKSHPVTICNVELQNVQPGG